MNRLMSIVAVAAVSTEMFYAEAREYYIHNGADESFFVSIINRDPRIVITPSVADNNPSVIVGRAEQPCGKGSERREKRYNVTFNGYIPSPGEEPYILFRNDRGEFRLVFIDENYAELHSDTASKIYDSPQRRKRDNLFTKSNLPLDTPYEERVQHWIVFDPYMAVYCYKMHHFALRAVDICRSSADTSWPKKLKEKDDCDFRAAFGLYPQLQPKHWYSGLCSRCTD
jgi:hypothetical protein